MKIIIMPDQPQYPMGIYNEQQCPKGTPDILDKAQFSIRNRFGFLSDSDFMSDDDDD